MSTLRVILVVAIGVLQQLATVSAGGWSYENSHGTGPSNWSGLGYTKCAGQRQSPIDIKPSSAVLENMGSFTFKGYNTSSGYSYQAINNGHTVQVNVLAGEMTVSGGSLPNGPYQLVQFHAHWGSANDVGSEHTVNGKSFPLEIHLVHFNTRYYNLSEPLNYDDSLAVLGIFAQVGATRNDALQTLIDEFDNITNAETSTQMDAFLMNGLLPSKTDEFVRYPGSLTTPACSEVVTWTVFRNPITITQTQLNAFRSLNYNAVGMNQDKMVNNFRPVQPINGRVVKRSYQEPGGDGTNNNSRRLSPITASALFGIALSLVLPSSARLG